MVAYADLADLADPDQLEMLFDFSRGSYLLTDTHTVSDQVRSIHDTMIWIVMLLSQSKDSKLLPKLLAPAQATLANLNKGKTIFGTNEKFAALGALSRYESALTTMLGLFAPVEATAKLLNTAQNSLTERKTYLKNVLVGQNILVERLTQTLKEKVTDAKTTRAQVEVLDSARLGLAGKLEEHLRAFESEILSTVHLTPADIVNLFSQLSFTNRDLLHPTAGAGGAGVSPAGVAATGAMLVSQAVDVVSKAIENVPSDLGGSVNRNLLSGVWSSSTATSRNWES